MPRRNRVYRRINGEIMNLKQELQQLNNRLDKCQRKLATAEERNDQALIAQFRTEINTTKRKIGSLKGQQNQQVNSQIQDVQALAFNRALTKAEQADMGKLKKSIRGLVVVHPMTALGREIGVSVVTGFAPSQF